ncbi:MAG: DUF1080 domain-containing protein [Gammaproteobacteria bacterium]|nr:DUF1080 domain-containing protein [Gammaproteobacteria bacterium]MYG97602.1 DUF1080 domain-containing protein [Gammaproteobacteria bacterium]
MKKPLLAIAVLTAAAVSAQDRAVWEPEPELVNAPANGAPPSDAIVLFDGTNLDQWMRIEDGEPARWEIADGVATVTPGVGSIRTRESFGSMQLHLEWRPTDVISGSGQSRGNSGVFLHGLFEVQILDSWENPTYVNGQAGSVYLQSPPLVNAARRPGEWQSYDIVFTAPVFEQGELVSPAYVTVFHNGVLVQNNVRLAGATFTPEPVYETRCAPYRSEQMQDCTGKMPLSLQDHGQVVSFRNIWLREL